MGMDIQVVVEGVETPAQRDLLRRSGCHWGQGYLFARPLPAEEISVGR
jgi:EAL domain-containing protein (putative c-di-GMP-specific phosphodiesterase class I)